MDQEPHIDFVPYEESFDLRELGFNELCYGLYHNDKTFYPTACKSHEQFHGQVSAAPLYQQAFRWFREKYKLYPEIGLHDREDEETWRITISILGYYELAYNQNVSKEPYHKTCEEAELACLKKLIEIVKSKSTS